METIRHYNLGNVQPVAVMDENKVIHLFMAPYEDHKFDLFFGEDDYVVEAMLKHGQLFIAIQFGDGGWGPLSKNMSRGTIEVVSPDVIRSCPLDELPKRIADGWRLFKRWKP